MTYFFLKSTYSTPTQYQKFEKKILDPAKSQKFNL
jgi:hypothetical protein